MDTFAWPTLVTLTGPTCSGKNYILDVLESDYDFRKIVSTTTREQRAGEVDGKDYYFITPAISKQWEEEGRFAELITFRGVRYGVTHEEMEGRMTDLSQIPIVILEPEGVAIYDKMCVDHGWDMLSIFVDTPLEERLKRLEDRTMKDIRAALSTRGDIGKIVATHTDRVLSATTVEETWINKNSWSLVVSGNDLLATLGDIGDAIKMSNEFVARYKKIYPGKQPATT